METQGGIIRVGARHGYMLAPPVGYLVVVELMYYLQIIPGCFNCTVALVAKKHSPHKDDQSTKNKERQASQTLASAQVGFGFLHSSNPYKGTWGKWGKYSCSHTPQKKKDPYGHFNYYNLDL